MESFDFVCSLGGSCATAKQLQFNNLRNCSLPFDWLFCLDDRPLKYLKIAFENNFNDWLLFENLRELEENERGNSKLFQYCDEASGYNFIHDFHQPKENQNEYDSVMEKYQRRIRRLLHLIAHSKNVLFVLDARYEVNIKLLYDIKQVIEKKYKTKVKFLLFQFNAHENKVERQSWITIRYISRNYTNDDYNRQPEEWNCLKNIFIKNRNIIGYFTDCVSLKNLRKKYRNLLYFYLYKKLDRMFCGAIENGYFYQICGKKFFYSLFKHISKKLKKYGVIEDNTQTLQLLSFYLKPKKIIIVSGFGQSGNSAVRDFLREFDENFVLMTEDWFIKYAGGLLDLKAVLLYNNNYYTADAAVKRFIQNVRYYKNFYDPQYREIIENALFNFVNKLIKNTFQVKNIPFNWSEASLEVASPYPLRVFVVKQLSENQFNEYASVFIREIFEKMTDKRNVVLVNSLYNPDLLEGMKLYRNVKIITCKRDLRDVYVDFKYNAPGSFIPVDRYKDIQTFFDSIYRNYPVRHKDVLNISFENLVLNYKKTSRKIKRFLKLQTHSNKKLYFNPVNSVKNVGVYKQFPDDEIIYLLGSQAKVKSSDYDKLEQLAYYKQDNINLENREKTAFLYSVNTSNLGDLCSSPVSSFPFPTKAITYDIVSYFNANEVIPFDKVIIGGGIHPWLYHGADFFNKLKASACIAWGVGLQTGDMFSKEFMDKFNLIGVRDVNCSQIDNTKVFYVPCSSCMNPAFDIVREEKLQNKHKVVFYSHYMLTTDEDRQNIGDIPILDNYDPDLLKVLRFLNSSEYVLTNSYHGAYWALLLGKKVIYKSFFNKKNGFLRAPVYVDSFECFQDLFEKAQSYPDYLDECRKINKDFYLKVLDILSCKTI